MATSELQVGCQYLLVSTDESFPELFIPLENFPITVGRGDGVDVSLSDHWVSRRHCQFDLMAEELTIQDLGSRYGTEVNEHLVKSRVIHPGDRIRIGISLFELRTMPAEELVFDERVH